MISLFEYIQCNISSNIFESGGFIVFFNTPEECKEYYKSNKDIFDKYGIDLDIIDSLYDLLDDEIPLTINPDTKEIKLRRLFVDNNIDITDLGEYTSKSNKQFMFKNGKHAVQIGDGGLSSRAKAGKNTAVQEQLLCEVINNKGDFDIDKYCLDNNLSSDFKLSAETQYNKFKEFIQNDNKYYAVRIGDKKNDITKRINNILSYKNLFNSTIKSYITPADIIAYIPDDKEDILNRLSVIRDDKDEFNVSKDIFIDLMLNTKQLIFISLKKIVKSNLSNAIEVLNVDDYNVKINDSFNFHFSDKGVIGNFVINDHDVKMNFRSNQNSLYPCTFEFNTKGSGGADGKAKTFLNNMLTLPSENDFYNNYKDNKNFDLIKLATEDKNIKYNLNIDNFDEYINDKKVSKYIENDKIYYIMIQCVIFLNFLNNLYNKNEFFDFVKDSYLSAKKISNYSLPYILIK